MKAISPKLSSFSPKWLLGAAAGFLLPGALLAQPFPDTPPANVTAAQDMAQMKYQLGISFAPLVPKAQDPNKITTYSARPSSAASPEGNWTDDRGNTITRSDAGHWNNYDDVPEAFLILPKPVNATPPEQTWRSAMNLYPPIDDLKMNDGTAVTTADQWWTKRRPEIYAAMQNELYGKIPDPSRWPSITWTLGAWGAATTANGAAYRQITITGTIGTTATIPANPPVGYRPPGANFVAFTPRNVPTITFSLRIPDALYVYNTTKQPSDPLIKVPAIVAYSGTAPWQYVAPYAPGGASAGPGHPYGYAVIGYNNAALQPDNGVGLTSYIIGLINQGNWRKPDDWGALAAWGWGISRLIDFLEGPGANLLYLDPQKLGVEGHSRYGKATLVTAAYEPRILAAYPSSAGSLGTAPYRRHYGQDLSNSIWDQEYHWMAGNFMKWAGPLFPGPAGTPQEGTGIVDLDSTTGLAVGPGTYLPTRKALMSIEAHSVAALIAPRVVQFSGGNNGDAWQDPYGMYLSLKDASKVWNFLGKKGLVLPDGVDKPALDTDYITGHLSYRFHTGGHTDVNDWPTFVRLATRFFDDVTPPTIGVPANLTVLSTSGTGAIANFPAPLAIDNVDDQVPVTLSLASGSLFPIGTTTVTATATDISHNSATESFTVTVTPLSIDMGGFVRNRRTNMMTQVVTLTNVSALPVQGPILLEAGGLSSSTPLLNATGSSDGSPSILVTNGSLAPGASISVTLEFAVPASGGINYSARSVFGASAQ